MPTYVYRFVDTGETLEIQQSFSDDTLTEAVHPLTGMTMPVRKIFQPVGVTFKGDGFYKTDSRGSSKTGAKAGDGDRAATATKPTGDGEKKSEGEKKSDGAAGSPATTSPAAASGGAKTQAPGGTSGSG